MLDKLAYAGSLGNRDLVEYTFTTNEIERIINFVAESHVDRSIENP